MVSVDGFFAGVDGDISWHNTDAEFGEFANKQTAQFGTMIFGRVTYDVMAGYWPTEAVVKNDPIVAAAMNNANKIVYSKTMSQAGWQNTLLRKEINVDEIKKLKTESQKNISVFGSGQIVRQFAKLGLVDEYRLMINPIVLGSGKPLFDGCLKLKLLSNREFKNGNVLLCYEPA